MAVKKRSGRKPTGRKADAPLSLRIDAELKQLIERSAGQRGKNLSQEIFRLLRLALGEDQKRSRDQEAQALCYLIGEAADACCLKGDDRINWTTDPWMFEAFRLTINEIIEPIRPHGEALSPANQRAWLANTPFLGPFDSPASRAKFVASMIWSAMNRDTAALPDLPEDMPANLQHAINLTRRLMTKAKLDLL